MRTSDFKFQKSEVPTELLYIYIDIIYLFVKWKHIHFLNLALNGYYCSQ